jgi:ketosteroid isomerase-like protein
MTLESRQNGPAKILFRLRMLAPVAVMTACLMAGLNGTVRADDWTDASQLLKQGQHAQALDKINQFLSGRPRDAQGRFLKGLILTELNRSAEAIDIFTRLTQDFPELPEPYNNLAVLYAAQGQYEKARQSLEMSIRTHPSYATAYENLGDVYTKLASQAYDKALQLDSSNSAAKTKLALVRDLVGSGTARPVAKPAARPEPQRTEVARSEAPKPAAAPPKPDARAVPPAAASVTASAAAPVAAAPKPPAEADAAKAAAPRAPAPAAAPGNDEITRAVQSWAQAWSAKDVKAYLAHYARDFKTPKGESRADWEKDRSARILAPKEIEVTVGSPRVTQSGDSSATVTFRQSYKSDRLNINSTKTLVMVRNSNGRWLIQQERVGS